MSQFTPFEVGQIHAHAYHGLGPSEIARIVTKPDGSTPSPTAIADVLEKLDADKKWRGQRKVGSGRPRVTTTNLDRKIEKAVLNNRGKVKVTVAYLQKKFPEARKVSKSCLEDRLHEAGLKWLRRRKKTLVPKQFKRKRIAWAKFVLSSRRATLNRWVFTDGTIFYLARTEVDDEFKKRGALGTHVWRRADRNDALFEDCVGPSAYWKAQGTPVRVWGMLVTGKLHIAILPEGTAMNRHRYKTMIEQRFPQWLDGVDRPLLVQDFEPCLRCEEPLEALAEIGVELVCQHSKYSQDLNPIENVWALLRERLYTTEPSTMESRDGFCIRLRHAVQWLNRNHGDTLLSWCTDQKERAHDVLLQNGGRTKW